MLIDSNALQRSSRAQEPSRMDTLGPVRLANLISFLIGISIRPLCLTGSNLFCNKR